MISAATRASKRWCKKFSPRRTLSPIRGNLCHESTELLRRAEAAKRLQGCDCLRDCWMASGEDRQLLVDQRSVCPLRLLACHAPLTPGKKIVFPDCDTRQAVSPPTAPASFCEDGLDTI